MFRRHWYWGMMLALISGLMTGCSSASARRQSGQAHPQSQADAAELPLEKAAQAHAHFGAGVVHEMNGENAAALDEYYQAARTDPSDEAMVLDVSGRLVQGKQFDKALEVASRAAGRPGASGAIFARLGLIYAQLGKTEQALAANRTAVKRAPGLLAGYRNLCLGYLQTKQFAEAMAVLDEAARQPSADAEFLIGLSELYINLGMQAPAQKDKAKAKALEALNRVVLLDPKAAALRLMLADSFNVLGDNSKAAGLYLDLLNRLPDVPAFGELREHVHAKLTDIYLRASDHKHASEQLEAIVRDNPANPAAYYYLGTLAFEDKKWAEAAEHFSKTILLSPDSEQAYYDLATCQLNLKQPAQALATLQDARQKFSRDAQNFVLEFITGLAYSQQKDYSRAMEYFNRAEVIAKAKEPKRLNQFFFFQLGATCERNGDLGKAEEYFQKSLEFEPEFAEALNYLGYMWAEHDMKLDQARQLIEKALKIEPKNGAYLDSLGWVLFKLHQPKEALDYTLKACDLLAEPDPTIFDHLGDIYAALQQPDKAREAWRKALALEPNEGIRKKLDGAPASATPKAQP
jgi:tetratricopeptide (TPR) repeat protein